MKKKKNIVALLILIFAFIALLIWLGTLCLEHGKKIKEISPYLPYLYYIGVTLFLLYFLVYPFLVVLFSPPYTYHFTCKPLEGKHSKKYVLFHYKKQVAFAKKILKKGNISLENRKLLKEALRSKENLLLKTTSLHELLINIVKKDIQKDIRKIIIDCAKDTLYLTSLSQNNFVDVLIVIVNNFRMLKKIVIRAGFRPSFFRLLKFYINVAFSSLIADGAQKLDIPSLFGNTLNGIAKPVIGSLIDGTINAFFMLRSGFLAKQYIFEEYNEKEEMINSAFLEATAALPELTISSVFAPLHSLLQKGIIHPTKSAMHKLFSKKKTLEIEEDLVEESMK